MMRGRKHQLVLEVRASSRITRHRFELGEGQTIALGRQGCDVRIADPAVSRRHLGFGVKHGRLMAGDLGSHHGTARNGRPIKRSKARRGDRFEIGGAEVRVLAFRRAGSMLARLRLPRLGGRRAARHVGAAVVGTFLLLSFFLPFADPEERDVMNAKLTLTRLAVGSNVDQTLKSAKFWVRRQVRRWREPAAGEDPVDYEYLFSRDD